MLSHKIKERDLLENNSIDSMRKKIRKNNTDRTDNQASENTAADPKPAAHQFPAGDTAETDPARTNRENTSGLTTAQVAQRIENGLTNRTNITTDKTTSQIIKSNVFTYFNLIFLILAVLLCLVGSFRNLTFLPVVIINTVIGILQELRAKAVLDKMNMLNTPHAVVIRDHISPGSRRKNLYRTT